MSEAGVPVYGYQVSKDIILDWLQEDLKNERMHLQMYLYGASEPVPYTYDSVKKVVEEGIQSEIKHVQQFQEMIYKLGGTPGQEIAAPYPDTQIRGGSTSLCDLRTHVLFNMEMAVSLKYAQRIRALETLVPTPASIQLKLFYEAQLADSYEDARKLWTMAHGYAHVPGSLFVSRTTPTMPKHFPGELVVLEDGASLPNPKDAE